MKALIATLVLLAASAAFPPGEERGTMPVHPLRVLYLGNADAPRAREFQAFLEQHFAKVSVAPRDGFDPAAVREADVVLLDWSQRDRGPNRLVSPLGERSAWSKPTVLLGSAGLNLADCWAVKGSWG
jgi:hypothetical protein